MLEMKNKIVEIQSSVDGLMKWKIDLKSFPECNAKR